MTTPVVEHGALVSHATGADPFIVQAQQLNIGPAKGAKYFVMEISSDRAGIVQVFWAAEKGNARASEFSEQNSIQFRVAAGPNMGMHRVPLDWEGTLRRLRIDFPDQARVKVRSVGLIETTDAKTEGNMDLSKAVPELARGSAENPVLFISWEAQDDVLPPAGKARGLCLSTKIGFVEQDDFFRLGVVFSVQARSASEDWKLIFRRGLMRRARDWEQWEIPIESIARENSGNLQLRFITDSYTRAQERNAPTWK